MTTKKKKNPVAKSRELHPNQVVKVLTSHETWNTDPECLSEAWEGNSFVVFCQKMHNLNLSMKKLTQILIEGLIGLGLFQNTSIVTKKGSAMFWIKGV